MPTPPSLIAALGLKPHPEGGHYREVHRSALHVREGERERSALTSIYYLLAQGEISRWHVVASDEVWHFYEGEPLELLDYDPNAGALKTVKLGPLQDKGNTRVHTIPAGHWQAARPLGAYALTGCTVAPGFEFADFTFVAELPGHEAAFEGALATHRSLL